MEPKITIKRNGPYVVTGVEVVRKKPIETADGEPIAWRKGETVSDGDVTVLCRCGGSSNKPFCDGTHNDTGFDGTEAPPQGDYADRCKPYEGPGIVVRDDRAICVHAGFCGTKATNVWKMTPKASETAVRSQVIAMVERCPSGALTYELEGETNEPDLPAEVSVIEDGPLWVTGRVEIERSDGERLEVRNRVTLCRCGQSSSKPLCDGTHKECGFTG